MRDLVDPALLPGLDLMPSLDLDEAYLPAIREGMEQASVAMPEPVGTGVLCRDEHVPAPDGHAVPVRIYTPEGTGPWPAILQIHGGGYIVGSVSTGHGMMMTLAASVGAVIVSVDYRLAPETPAPGSVEDCYAALLWLVERSAQLGIDPSRIAVAGQSAGGGLAAALTLMARDRGGPAIVHQNLTYPMLDDRTCVTPQPDHLGAFVWTPQANSFGWRCLLGQEPGGADVPPYAVPARAADLSGLPPAFITVGALDLFLAEDLDYARRLIEAKVPTELHVYPGAYHGFDVMANAPVSTRMQHDMTAALRRALHGD